MSSFSTDSEITNKKWSKTELNIIGQVYIASIENGRIKLFNDK